MRAFNDITGSVAFMARTYHWRNCSARLTTLSEFPFNKYSTFVDVGGGIGAFSLPLAQRYKHIKVTIHDLPEALVQARTVSTLLRNHP